MPRLTVDQRIIAALRFEDIATGSPVRAALHIRGVRGGPKVKVEANRNRMYIVRTVTGLEAYARTFEDPPAQPPVGAIDLELEVRDPSGTYLPRQFSLAVPRNSTRGAENSVFEPLVVQLLRSPRAAGSRNWAMIRVHLNIGATLDPVPMALLRVVHDAGGSREVLGWGMSVLADPEAKAIEREEQGMNWLHFGARQVGEASVPVAGLNGQIWGEAEDDPVTLDNIPATLEVLPMTTPESSRLPDPDHFFDAAAVANNTRDISLAVGGIHNAETFSVTL